MGNLIPLNIANKEKEASCKWRDAQRAIYRLFFGAFECDMLGKGEYHADGRLD